MTDENNASKETINEAKEVKKVSREKKRNTNKRETVRNNTRGEKKEKEKTNVTVSAKVTKNTKSTRGTRNINKKQNQDIFKKSNLKIIPLGGLHEIGKNITVFEYVRG